jgi:hypothetical protein
MGDESDAPQPLIEPVDSSQEEPLEAGGVGGRCGSDADCDAGLFCMQSDSDDWFGAGPPNGYCTQACSEDISCSEDAACLLFGDGEAYCLQVCEVGAGAPKCNGRGDLACDGVSVSGLAFCRPVCRSDTDCGSRHCDLGLGVCVDEPPLGDPIGAQCDPDAEESTCASQTCMRFSDTYASCSAVCNLSYNGCGSDGATPDNPGDPSCVFPAVAGSSVYDLGFCSQRCECDGDCLHSDARCLILPEDAWEVLGTPGICVDPDFPADDPEVHLGRACP